jgi:hypothetical protein
LKKREKETKEKVIEIKIQREGKSEREKEANK